MKEEAKKTKKRSRFMHYQYSMLKIEKNIE